MRRLFAAMLFFCQPGFAHAQPMPEAERTQFILLSMDTTPSGHRPVENTDFHRILRRLNDDAEHPENSFTVFVSTGGLQIDPATRRPTDRIVPYLGRTPRNRPVIRYAEDLSHLRSRAAAIRRMHELGIEIGAHAVRHRHGAEFTNEEWTFELTDHERILDLVDLPHPVGFRAPFLEFNDAMYRALHASGYRYDVSRSGRNAWPSRHPETGVWLFEIPSFHIPDASTPVLLFDDNVISILRGIATRRGVGPDERQEFIDDTFHNALRSAFERRYRGARAPLLISGHGGLISPTIRFMRDACERPNVRCATFSEAVAYMEQHRELEGVRGR